jgi:methylene-tetrahydromethanopterin dehydrogenase
MAAAEGAEVTLTSRRLEAAESAARELGDRDGVRVTACAAATEAEVAAAAARADILLATGAAGVRLVSVSALRGPKIVADVNAVPPAGIEGLAPPDDGKEILPGIFGIGALAIGALKNRVEASLLKDLLAAEQPLVLDRAAARRRAGDLLAAAR